MRRAWKISAYASLRADLFLRKTPKPKILFKPLISPTSKNPPNPFRFLLLRGLCTAAQQSWPNSLSCLTSLFDNSRAPCPRSELLVKVSELKDKLVNLNGESMDVCRVLEEKGLPLFVAHLDGSALIMLLEELRLFPQLAVEVFNWRRRHASHNFPITPEEYSKGIVAAGKAKNINLAVELFTEASNNRAKTCSTYNALMCAYMYNSMPDRCQLLFWELKREEKFSPTTVTYNILISVFGRLMLVDHMEATFQHIYDSNLSPDLRTFNNLISGYVTAWMWDRMESTYSMMKERSVKPDTHTHLLLLRGYAHAGKLEKMEEMYELVKEVVGNDVILIRCMLSAYCKIPSADRIKRIEELMALIPDECYCSWLNVLLIRFYARLQLLERMEALIDVAFERETAVMTTNVMRAIITVYYRFKLVDKLAGFVKRAECAGWRLCRSVYHCKMVMYGAQNRMDEMESVIDEMKNIKMRPTKKTFLIMYSAYTTWGPRYKVEQVVGLMCKHGYGIILDVCTS